MKERDSRRAVVPPKEFLKHNFFFSNEKLLFKYLTFFNKDIEISFSKAKILSNKAKPSASTKIDMHIHFFHPSRGGLRVHSNVLILVSSLAIYLVSL